MDISREVVREVLELSNNEAFKNQCAMVLDSHLSKEPQLTKTELRQVLKVYLKGIDYD